MTEMSDTQDEGPEDPDEQAEGEMSADERARLDVYLVWLVEEGNRAIERAEAVDEMVRVTIGAAPDPAAD
jgi:hypothetical protein